jgi:hypothetical protein
MLQEGKLGDIMMFLLVHLIGAVLSLDTCVFFYYACAIYDDTMSEQEVLEMEDAGGDLPHVRKVVVMDCFLS